MVAQIIIGSLAVALVAFTLVFNLVRRKKGCCGLSCSDSCSGSCSTDKKSCNGCNKCNNKPTDS